MEQRNANGQVAESEAHTLPLYKVQRQSANYDKDTKGTYIAAWKASVV
jgi:hypothetical protein